MVVEYEIVERENKNVDIKYIENRWILKDLPKDTRMIFFYPCFSTYHLQNKSLVFIYLNYGVIDCHVPFIAFGIQW